MRLNSSDLYLSLIRRVLKANIEPELQSPSARLSLEVVLSCLAELQRREQYTPQLLRSVNEEAQGLLDEMRGLLKRGDNALNAPGAAPQAHTLAQLISSNERVTAQIVSACRELLTINAGSRVPDVTRLLRRAAE